MMDTLSKFTFPGVLFGLTLAFGFWLSHAGKPYNGVLFNIHKLAALGAVVLTVMQFWRMPGPIDSVALIIGLLIVAALSVLALFISGALMSAGKLDYALMLTIHRLVLPILVIVLGLVLYLLEQRI